MTLSEFRYLNKSTGHNFFERKTMKFFNSRLESSMYGGRYFITSEQYIGIDDIMRPRKFTVRQANDDGSVTTVGEFQKFNYVEDARIAIKALLKGVKT